MLHHPHGLYSNENNIIFNNIADVIYGDFHYIAKCMVPMDLTAAEPT